MKNNVITLKKRLQFGLIVVNICAVAITYITVDKLTTNSLKNQYILRGFSYVNAIQFQIETRLDKGLLSRYISSISAEPQINKIVFVSESGEVIAGSNRSWIGTNINEIKELPFNTSHNFNDLKRSLDNSKEQTRELFINDVPLTEISTNVIFNKYGVSNKLIQHKGRLILYLDRRPIQIEAQNTILRFMIILMSGFVFLWITTLYVYNIFVDKRLNKILLGIKVNTLGNKDSRIDENNLDEIGNVANYINESFDNVQQNEKVLIGLIEDANSANKIKTEFLASMSHEIRTPINGIQGMLTLLEKRLESGQNKSYVKVAMTASDNLLKLINNVLDFSKIEADKMLIEKVSFNMKEELENIITLMNFRAVDNNVNLSLLNNFDKDYQLLGDVTKLKQIMFNLISNAIKFSKNATVDVVVSGESTDDKISINIKIIDTGIGIKDDDLERIFIEFTQADSSTTRKYGGTGLGLSISKKLANAMGGGLKVESEYGKGTTFSLDIVMDIDKAEKKEVESSIYENITIESNRDKLIKVLIVEDNEINLIVIEGYLDELGIDYTSCVHGGLALDYLESEQGNTIGLVLMDCQLPVLDGYETTKRIRELNSTIKDIPIIAMTANTYKEDRDRCFDSGMNDYLPKPIDIKLLQKILEKNSFQIKSVDKVNEKSNEHFINDFHWDKNAALDRVRQKEERLKVLIKLFVEDMPSRVKDLSLKMEQNNFEQSKSIAHTVKGPSLNLGLLKFVDLLKQIERAETSHPFDDQMVNRMLTEFNLIIDLFNEFLKQED